MSCLAASNVSACDGPRLLISATMHLKTKPKPISPSYFTPFQPYLDLISWEMAKWRPTWWWREGNERRGGAREHRRPEKGRGRGGDAPGFHQAKPCKVLWIRNRPSRSAPLSCASFASSTSSSLSFNLSFSLNPWFLVLWSWEFANGNWRQRGRGGGGF